MSIANSEQETPSVAPPEPDLTADELVARAEEIAPSLIERQAETEQRTFYAEDTHEAFKEAGFYRVLQPRRYGGYEFDVETFLRIGRALARGCPSTGWMYTLGSSHSLTIGSLYGESAQAQLFGDGHFVCPATVKPQGSAVRADDGGWIIDGEFNYCSGSPYATHFMGHTFAKPEKEGDPAIPMMFVAPRSEWTRLDDWGAQLGLKGSGSHSIKFDNGHIPAEFALPGVMLLMPASVTNKPGADLHPNPMYAGSSLSFFMFEFATLSVGIAWSAFDAFEELLTTKMTPLPPLEPRTQNADYQRWYGTGLGQVAAAEAALQGVVRQWTDLAERRAFTTEDDMRYLGICREIYNLCWAAVQQHFFRTAGSSSIKNGERIERVWRDMSQLHSHTALSFFHDTAARNLTKSRFDVS